MWLKIKVFDEIVGLGKRKYRSTVLHEVQYRILAKLKIINLQSQVHHVIEVPCGITNWYGTVMVPYGNLPLLKMKNNNNKTRI